MCLLFPPFQTGYSEIYGVTLILGRSYQGIQIECELRGSTVVCLCYSCPSLVVLDDVDMLCPHQNTSPSEMERQATAALSALLDDLHTRPPPSHMVVIATTNQLERVETSIRRPGRLDKEIEIPVPTVGGRKEVRRKRKHVLMGDEHYKYTSHVVFRYLIFCFMGNPMPSLRSK